MSSRTHFPTLLVLLKNFFYWSHTQNSGIGRCQENALSTAIRTMVLCILAYGAAVAAQSTTPLRIDFTPQSPDTASLYKTSDIEVGKNTGAPNLHIPLLVLEEGPLSVPVSLSYASAGHKVTERATWVGLGWTLNAGGAVSREVRGLADDTDAGNGFLTYRSWFNSVDDILGKSDLEKVTIYDRLTNFNCEDSEPDVFSFQVGNLSGRFMFDWDGSLKVSSNQDVQVSFNQEEGKNEILEWVIVDGQGVTYTFSKREFNEKTDIYGMGILNCTNRRYTTSWKLTRIQDALKVHELEFAYEDYSMAYDVPLSTQHTITAAGASKGVNSSGSGLEISGSYLKQIQGRKSGNAINFAADVSMPRTDVSGVNLFPLGSLMLEDKFKNVVSRYDFDYKMEGRLLLIGIDQKTPVEDVQFYRFEYNSKPLPDYNSKATDHWGFYNGKLNSVPYPEFVLQIPQGSGPLTFSGADKSPDPRFGQASLITKVVYPTKGYSTFEYEGHDYSFVQSTPLSELGLFESVARQAFVEATGSREDLSELVYDEKFFDISILQQEYDKNTVFDSQSGLWKRRVSMSLNALNIAPVFGQVLGPRFQIYNSNNEVVYQINSIPYDDEDDGEYYHDYFDVWLPVGRYKMRVETKNAPHQFLANFIVVQASWNNDTNSPILKMPVGGVRVKRISDYDSTGELVKEREFSYALNDQSELSSGVILTFPKYEDHHFYHDAVDTNAAGLPLTVIKHEYVRYSGGLLQLGSALGHVRYHEVTVHEGVGTERFKTVSKYSHGIDDIISFEKPYAPATTHGYSQGLLVSETKYRVSGSVQTPVQESINTYHFKSIRVQGLKVGRAISGDCYCSSVNNYAAAAYDTFLGFNQPASTVVRTYFENGPHEILTQNGYDTNLKKVKRISTTLSHGEESIVEYVYPDDITGPADISVEPLLAAEFLAIEKLKNSHRVALPIQMSRFSVKNGQSTLVLTDRTIYKDWGGGIVLPAASLFAKGGEAFEERQVIHSYDDYGNPREVSLDSGPHTVLIWGYEKMNLIARIDHAFYEDLAGFVPVIQDLSTSENGFLDEQALREALNVIRSQSSSVQPWHVTSYTYDPLVGVTSMTDPRGQTVFYRYDALNRLKHVVDTDGNVISTNQYHYKD